MKNLPRNMLVAAGGGGSTGTGAMWTPIAVDLSGGYDRATIIVTRGAESGAAAAGTVNASVYESATSGGTYAAISGAIGTSGTTGNKKTLIIDIPVNASKPFLKIYGTASTTGTSAFAAAATVIAYHGSRTAPPTQDQGVILV